MPSIRFLIANAAAFLLMLSAQISFGQAPADKNAPPMVKSAIKVMQIDIEGLKKVLRPDGRPLVINFWATWCPPCVAEFPDLVKMHGEYRGKVDFVTVSLDDLADIDTYVPKFLEEMSSEMPAYLLHTTNENAAIALVSRDWGGNLPMTVLYDASGRQVYTRMGKLRPEALRENIVKLLPAADQKPAPSTPAN
jgi:thiol-disulfide isomerase/thioredoxin